MQPIDPGIEALELRVYAKDQPEYIQLPSRATLDGTVVTLWKMTWRERWQMFWRGQFYLTILTFNHPLQPVKLSLYSPAGELLPPPRPPRKSGADLAASINEHFRKATRNISATLKGE